MAPDIVRADQQVVTPSAVIWFQIPKGGDWSIAKLGGVSEDASGWRGGDLSLVAEDVYQFISDFEYGAGNAVLRYGTSS
jgi:hypothetical protein